jgi:hypothetical protein
LKELVIAVARKYIGVLNAQKRTRHPRVSGQSTNIDNTTLRMDEYEHPNATPDK